jgi:hypothetical protein
MPFRNFDTNLSFSNKKYKNKYYHLFSLVRLAFWSLYGYIDSSFEWYRLIRGIIILLWTHCHHSIWIFSIEQKIWIFETNIKEPFASILYNSSISILGISSFFSYEYGKFKFCFMSLTSRSVIPNYWKLLFCVMYIMFKYMFLYIKMDLIYTNQNCLLYSLILWY